jgi:hypothetical protein
MAAFSRSRRPLFGAQMDPATPPIMPQAAETEAHEAVSVQPGFRRPSTAQMIAGVLGDTLANIGGGQGIFLPQLAQQRQLAQQSAMAQQERGAEFADWERRKQWERANPAPINNDTIADYEFRARTLGKPAADEWLKSASDPVVTVTLPGNRVYSGPRSGLAAALGGGAQPAQRPEIGVELPDPRKRGGAGPGQPTFQPSAVMDSLIQQESGGRPGVLGPQTRYGQAQGLTQMLPATAEAVAKRLGVPWRPDLMTGTSKAAADYQRALGQAYLEEGYQTTGNIRDALHYYHGGPSRKLWGPKTRGYADSVISRMRVN